MGQTLTHGIYLPDEGERNCYNGLAGNWQILDGSVGTIAAHTSALAGKAPLVHTHTVSQITDFPAYGNAAGTICEGNDSRLSDARTPVAHTHGKADITDLFNSANTWSADQTFSAKILTKTANTEIAGEDVYQCLKSDGKRAITFRVSNNSNYRTLLLGVHNTNNSAPKGLVISNDNSNNITIFSDSPDGLGTSTNKWKTLNGINPGALSLPTTDVSKLDYFSGDITDLTGGLNSKSFALDGWVTIFMPNVSGDFIAIDTSIGQVISISGTGVGDANIACICPVRAGITNRIYCKCSSALTAAFIPCAGSV